LTIWQAIVLGLVQGVTEFLPVSSSGHLVIAGALLDVPRESLTFDIMVHFGTLIAVLVALKDDWYPILLGVLGHPQHKQEGRKRFFAVLVGSLPVAAAGLLLKDQVEELFAAPRFAAAMLLVTGAILWFSDRAAERRDRSSLTIPTLSDALWIGCGQALAILPGISRSGSTLAAGLMRGFGRQGAARFAFLLAIPAILGATLIELPSLFENGMEASVPILAGTASAALAGYASIALFLRFLKSGSLKGFAVYTWLAGLLALWLVGRS